MHNSNRQTSTAIDFHFNSLHLVGILLILVCNSDNFVLLFPWQNTSLPAAVRILNIISLLTVEEKASLLSTSNPAIPRINLPAYSFAYECERGFTSGGAGTAFPSGVGLAGTFNSSLVFEVARWTALEARASTNVDGNAGTNCFGPVLNFIHDATWGRTNEMLTGEDTFLGSVLGSAFVNGLQSWREASNVPGDFDFYSTSSTVKHLNGYSGPEGYGYTFGRTALRFSFDVMIPSRAWKEFFLPQYRAAALADAAGYI